MDPSDHAVAPPIQVRSPQKAEAVGRPCRERTRTQLLRFHDTLTLRYLPCCEVTAPRCTICAMAEPFAD